MKSDILHCRSKFYFVARESSFFLVRSILQIKPEFTFPSQIYIKLKSKNNYKKLPHWAIKPSTSCNLLWCCACHISVRICLRFRLTTKYLLSTVRKASEYNRSWVLSFQREVFNCSICFTLHFICWHLHWRIIIMYSIYPWTPSTARYCHFIFS